MKVKKNIWRKVKWPFNDEKPFCDWDCSQLKVGKGKIIIYPVDENEWSYVASFGPDSERSHSGSFGRKVTLAEAQKEIEDLIENGKI